MHPNTEHDDQFGVRGEGGGVVLFANTKRLWGEGWRGAGRTHYLRWAIFGLDGVLTHVALDSIWVKEQETCVALQEATRARNLYHMH